MKKFTFFGLKFFTVFFLCAPALFAAKPDYSVYDGLLKDHVRQVKINGVTLAGVDYVKWTADERHAKAMKMIADTDPKSLSQPEKMAYWINAYNLLTIDLIIKNDEKESIKNLGSVFSSPWKKHKWTLKNGVYTLDQIEHAILRPMGNPGVHFAIVCASVSCPDLRKEAFVASRLQAQFDDQAKAFLKNADKGLDPSGGEPEISKIMDWFEDDFGDEAGVLKYVNAQLGSNYKDIGGYLNYDWSLNDARR